MDNSIIFAIFDKLSDTKISSQSPTVRGWPTSEVSRTLLFIQWTQHDMYELCNITNRSLLLSEIAEESISWRVMEWFLFSTRTPANIMVTRSGRRFLLQWRNNEPDGVWSHQPHDCLLKRSFKAFIQRKHQSSASLAFVWGIHRWPVNSPHEWPVTRKMFPFDDVILGDVERSVHLNTAPPPSAPPPSAPPLSINGVMRKNSATQEICPQCALPFRIHSIRHLWWT